MSISLIPDIVQRFLSISWTWVDEDWPMIMNLLGLKLKEQAGERITYTFLNDFNLDVFFSGVKVDFLEVTVDACLDVDELSESEYENKIDEYYGKFRTAVSLVTPLLGESDFCNGSAADGFPEDQDAVWLALWRIGNARLMIQQKHEDRELPFRICVVLTPLESE